jgi:hypothetical protein
LCLVARVPSAVRSAWLRSLIDRPASHSTRPAALQPIRFVVEMADQEKTKDAKAKDESQDKRQQPRRAGRERQSSVATSAVGGSNGAVAIRSERSCGSTLHLQVHGTVAGGSTGRWWT